MKNKKGEVIDKKLKIYVGCQETWGTGMKKYKTYYIDYNEGGYYKTVYKQKANSMTDKMKNLIDQFIAEGYRVQFLEENNVEEEYYNK